MNKPKVVVSRCIEFDKCRWNGLIIASPIVKTFKPFFDFIPVCPEVEIGLGVPRDPIRLIERNGRVELENSANGENHTGKMDNFAETYLSKLPPVQGFILKSRSPSCGTNNVKVHSPKGNVISGKGIGLFADKVNALPALVAIEDETRLLNMRIREHFLTKLYAFSRLAHIQPNMKELIEFHSHNKYLFMAYNQQKQKEAGVIIANHSKDDPKKVFQEYSLKVGQIFSKMPRISTNINVLLHLFGYFSKKHLKESEKTVFLDLLERYRAFQVPLVALTSIIKMWTAEYNNLYLMDQTYLQPFPKDLQTIFDTGKGRIEKELLKT